MESDILKTARREAEALRAELARNPAFQKLQQVQRLIDVYESYEGVKAEEPTPPARRAQSASGSRPGTKLAQVEAVVLAHLRGKGARMTSGQLLPVLIEMGIEMGGKVPSKTLASMLSNSQKLSNLKGYGYGPSDWGDKPFVKDHGDEAPPGEPAGASQITGSEGQTSLLNMDSGSE